MIRGVLFLVTLSACGHLTAHPFAPAFYPGSAAGRSADLGRIAASLPLPAHSYGYDRSSHYPSQLSMSPRPTHSLNTHWSSWPGGLHPSSLVGRPSAGRLQQQQQHPRLSAGRQTYLKALHLAMQNESTAAPEVEVVSEHPQEWIDDALAIREIVETEGFSPAVAEVNKILSKHLGKSDIISNLKALMAKLRELDMKTIGPMLERLIIKVTPIIETSYYGNSTGMLKKLRNFEYAVQWVVWSKIGYDGATFPSLIIAPLVIMALLICLIQKYC